MTLHTATVIDGLKEISASDIGHGQSNLTFKLIGQDTVSLTRIPSRLADMIVETFHEYEDWLSGQEGPAVDDALAAKSAADARA